MEAVHYYLGANTPRGFESLYDKFLTDNDRLFIIKGSPGSGKSTFMKKLAQKGIELGTETEVINCSGDPESLDGVYFPKLGIAYVDGTAPHVIEPTYAGVRETYLNFAEFIDMQEMWKYRVPIMETVRKYKAEYAKAYKALNAAGAVYEGIFNEVVDEDVRETVIKKANRLAKKEFKSEKGTGEVKERFIDAFTCQGMIHRYDTVAALSEQVYLVDAEFGLNHLFVETVANYAINCGLDVILCRDALFPDKIAHVIVPKLGVSVVSRYGRIFPDWDARTIRIDAIPNRSRVKSMREHIRMRKGMCSALLGEANGYLKMAKYHHDRLEALYRPHLDFYALDKFTDKHLDLLENMI